MKAEQGSHMWTASRGTRITASIAYEIFTYCQNSKPDWARKVRNTLRSEFKGNSATFHGLKWEGAARERFQEETNEKVETVGLVVNPNIPWLGASPDALVRGKFILEIKCPLIGKKQTVTAILKDLKFLTNVEGTYKLKENHKFYGQVQLTMMMTGTSHCIFIIYSSCDSSMYQITVSYNDQFVRDFVLKLTEAYFQHILPILCSLDKE